MMKEKIEIYLEQLVDEGVFPGCNYCLITPEETIFGNVGYKSLIPVKEKNKIDDIHDIASLTKLVVTNTLVSFLLRDQRLNLDDSVAQYIDNFLYPEVKIINLLTHSSGLKALFNKYELKDKSEFTEKLELEFEPGTNIHYVDINFILLGFIIEKLYGESIDILADKYIFKPLNMKDTCYNPKAVERCVPTELTDNRGLVVGTVHDEKAAFLGGVAGHAGVFSTTYDLRNFVEMVLSNGYYKGYEYLDKKYIDNWFQALYIGEDGIRRTCGWCYGKSSKLCQDVCGEDTIIHTGFPGHHILIDRTNDIGIILLSNRIHPTRENKKLIDKRKDINKKIYDILKEYHRI